MTAPTELTPKQFAEHLGVKPGYVTRLKADGRLVLTDDRKRVRVAESVARIHATRDPARASKLDTEAPPASGTNDPAGAGLEQRHDFQDARAKREHYAAESAELEFRRAAGELMEAALVTATVADAVVTLRGRLETLPDLLAPQIAALSDEQAIRATLAEHVEHMLGELAAHFGKLGAAA